MSRKLNRAKELVDGGAALAVVNGCGEFTFNEQGVKTLLKLQTGTLAGAYVADKVVGKAAAMLMVRGRTLEVYAQTISLPALDFLRAHNVLCVYDKVVPVIMRRDGGGICPLEETVMGIGETDRAYEELCKKMGLEP